MKWKLKPGEVITYKTIMKGMDTGKRKVMNFGFMGKLMDSTMSGKMSEMLKEIRGTDNDTLLTTLRNNKRNNIDIQMNYIIDSTKPVFDTSARYKNFRYLINKMTDGVVLRGEISEIGHIESFYTVNRQKNLIALFFELPGKAVKVGDSWALNINSIAMDSNFQCDSSYKKNSVTLTAINTKNGETVVTVKYDIIEFATGRVSLPFGDSPSITTMYIKYQGFADFSIEKGKWIKYEVIKSDMSNGMMTQQSIEKYSLISN